MGNHLEKEKEADHERHYRELLTKEVKINGIKSLMRLRNLLRVETHGETHREPHVTPDGVGRM